MELNSSGHGALKSSSPSG